FNPAANAGTNALRVVSGDGANYRIVFGLAGGTVNLDGAVNVAEGGGPARVTATAYSNNRAGLPGGGGLGGTMQYALDSATSALYRVNPPNNGTLTERRALPVPLGEAGGLDVVTGSDRLLAVLEVHGVKGLYELDAARGLLGRHRELPAEIVDLAFPIPVTLAAPVRQAAELTLRWVGGIGPFELLRSTGVEVPMERWLSTSGRAASVVAEGAAGYFRVLDLEGGRESQAP
ncbi:MAG: DUF4394 domain-containing protein, partial [Verrucomicrobiales bacterium]|nr:DUF4394 domain-containing protein [Verrucomicrobiales bacterium]